MTQIALASAPPSADDVADPLNRVVRYPLARLLSRVALKTPLQADHVTFTHLACGLAAAVLVARGVTGVAPWVLLELRMVLDCLDGVVARARGTCSARGRAKDEMADAAGFLALLVAIAIRTHAWLLGLALLAIAAVTAAGYAVLKRRLLGTTDLDPADPFLFLTRFGDRTAGRIFPPATPTRGYVSAVSLLSWDNALPLVHLGVLAGALVYGEIAALAYGVLATLVVLMHRGDRPATRA
ncbi:MAG TPA: CDP-alcohol phosphatidyltransferase family protein [Labilithrix sp.]